MKKNQKPIDIDLHLKYRCPNQECGTEHWLSLKEAQTKSFIVVCYCGEKFRIKRVKKCKIHYNEPLIKEPIQHNIPKTLLESCVKIMSGFGFDAKESTELLTAYYKKDKIDDPITLVKKTISCIGVNND